MATTTKYDALFKKAAKQVNKRPVTVDGEPVLIPWQLLKSLSMQESGLNPNAKSEANALGIMQILPSTAKSLGVGDEDDLYNPKIAIPAGAKYLKKLLRQFGGDFDKMLAGYNAGPTNVRRGENKYGGELALQYVVADDFATLSSGKSQTQDYIQKIREKYRSTTGKDLPGESYYRAMGALGYDYDRFASGRDSGLETLDSMPTSEMIAAIGSGELNRDDVRYLSDMATKRGNTELADRIKSALGYDQNRPEVGSETFKLKDETGEEEVKSRGSALDVMARPGSMGSVEEAERLLAQIEARETEERGAQLLAVAKEYGPEVFNSLKEALGIGGDTAGPGPVLMAASPAGGPGLPLASPPVVVTPTSPPPSPRTAPAIRTAPAPAPAPAPNPMAGPPVLAVPQAPIPTAVPPVPAAVPPAPVAPTRSNERVVPMADKTKRTRRVTPQSAALDARKAAETEAKGKGADFSSIAVAGAPSTADVSAAYKGDPLYEKFLAEYASNMAGEGLSLEEQFLRQAAAGQYMGDVARPQVGVGEFVGASLRGVEDPLLLQQKRNLGALERYRNATGLGKGESRRGNRLRALEGANTIASRYHNALREKASREGVVTQGKVAVEVEKDKRRTNARKAFHAAGLQYAKALNDAADRGVSIRGQDTKLLGALVGKGKGKLTADFNKGLMAGGAESEPYVKVLYDESAKIDGQLSDLGESMRPSAWSQQAKNDVEVRNRLQFEYSRGLELSTKNLGIAAQLASLNLTTPNAEGVFDRSVGILAEFLSSTDLDAAMAGKLPGDWTLKLSDEKKKELSSAVGKRRVSIAEQSFETQLKLLNSLYKYDDASSKMPERAAYQIRQGLAGQSRTHLTRIYHRIQMKRGRILDPKTGVWVSTGATQTASGLTPRDDALAQTLMKKTYGIKTDADIAAEQARAAKALGEKRK